MFRFVSITLRTFPCLLYCLTTHEKPRRYRWGSGAANSLKVWKVFRKTLRFLVKHPPLTDEEAEVGPFYGPTKMLFLMEKKKKVDD